MYFSFSPKGAGKALPDLPEITSKQLGKKIDDHFVDYGLTRGKEGAMAYKEITENALQNTTLIREGKWKTLPGNSQFWISGNDVVITNNGKWVLTFPLNKPGTLDYINKQTIIWKK